MSAKVAVIGGGAAGMMVAIWLADGGADVTLFEKNEKLGKKMYITGKGRCNLTNACDGEDFFDNVVHGKKYLRSAINGFSPSDAMDFFNSLGTELVVERGNRVFPASGKSSDVIKALVRRLAKLKVDVRLNCAARDICKKDGGFVVKTDGGSEKFDKVVVATGGVSYPSTGSTGDGYKFAQKFGHGIVSPKPALSPIPVKQNVAPMDGLLLKNVALCAYCGGKKVADEFGEMMFTKSGLSGAIALTVSSYICRLEGEVKLSLDLKPALDEAKLDARLLRDFDERKNCDVAYCLRALLPDKLNAYVLRQAGVDGRKAVNSVTKEERAAIVRCTKRLCFDVSGAAPFEEAIITSGGVDLAGLKPDGESKFASGLYFVGETVDVDALTGGFNMQIAFATAVKAAKDILKSTESGMPLTGGDI